MYHTAYHSEDLSAHSFLITGGAGFIGSHIVEYLLQYGAGKVRVLDNLSTGNLQNIEPYLNHSAFEFIEGDIRDLDVCKRSLAGMDFVSHQAALGSVPRSINDPITTNQVNISGFLNILCSIKEETGIKRFVYAASSSTYGDSKELPKVEDRIGKPLSPYAVTKLVNELYADVFSKTYGMEIVGLRYFNVFGPRQSPTGMYAAAIPLFIQAIQDGSSLYINGDGEQTRDFTYVENAVQANIKAFFVKDRQALNQVYNVALGHQTSLNTLVKYIAGICNKPAQLVYKPERQGDVRDSLADISKASRFLDYQPTIDILQGLKKTIS